ncbi:prepilin peptidase [Desulfovibrio inopinatus]|uniref:prepilin peptidase n=1 Tax=Desulfovibrio inopinatus TaxID=102109 RepID=UPI0004265174|nr:A24 family peptidase [Desulfovibrio inopinatus]
MSFDFNAYAQVFPFLAIVLGLVLGSFYNVCVHRYLTEQSIVFPGSHCPQCDHPLAWYENIPIISFLFLAGRCRYCKASIRWRYPILEALSGLWSYALAITFGPSLAYLLFMVIGGMYLVASFIDLDSFILPDIITYPAAVIAYLGSVFILDASPVLSGAAAVAGAGLFYLLNLLYRLSRGFDGLGLGDVKLMVSIGALVQLVGLPFSVLYASLSALLVSPFFLIGKKNKSRTPIPFGPFLCLGAMLYILFGPGIFSFLR